MKSPRQFHCLLRAALAAAASAGLSAAQSLQVIDSHIPLGNPFNNSFSENVDFGDIDLDGDFDAAFADGGDLGNDQNRIWINLGGAQAGALGFFQDETATRAPALLDSSRDIEFVDFDADGDLDVYVANHASIANQGGRWWVNRGGLQGGSAGFFVDETSTRWVGLGGPGSSIPPSLVLGSGGYIDYSGDGDFADLDNDGDMDLIASSYGATFNANVPTRMFLSDGSGHFAEHNPGGFQGGTIADGAAALWAEGTQQANTLDATGLHADVAASTLDVELADIDADWDVDLLLGARGEPPRMFKNRLSDAAALVWRDSTSAVFGGGYHTGGGSYAQEMGDFDNDDDLDVYGVNWLQASSTFDDETLINDGSGTYVGASAVVGASSVGIEADFGDFDNDGDVDVFLATFGGTDQLLRNGFAPSGVFSLQDVTASEVLGPARSTLDIDWADVDNDGDTDAMSADDSGQPNALYVNLSQQPDAFAPRIAHVEPAPNRVAGAAPTVVRVHVYDNAAAYVTWSNPTHLEYRVNGGPFYVEQMVAAGGQLFRGEIPGALIGTIDYRVRSSDRSANTSISALSSYLATSGGCDGSLATYCTAKATSIPGCLPAVSFNGTPSASARTGFLVQAGPTPGKNAGLYLYTVNGQQAPVTTAFGLLCISTSGMKRIGAQNGGGNAGVCNGAYALDFNAFATSGADPALIAGESVDTQVWYRDAPNPGGANFTNAGAFVYCP